MSFQCNRLRIVIDVATGDWLVLMEQVIQTVSAKDPTSLKHLVVFSSFAISVLNNVNGSAIL